MATGNFTTGIRFKIKAVRFNEHKDFLSWTATDVSPTHTQTLVLINAGLGSVRNFSGEPTYCLIYRQNSSGPCRIFLQQYSPEHIAKTRAEISNTYQHLCEYQALR